MGKGKSKKSLSIPGIILIILGIAASCYGLGVNAIVSSTNWFNFAFCYFGIVLIALSFLLKPISKLPTWLKLILIILVFAVVLNFILTEIKIISAANQEPQNNADYVIVLGAKVNKNGVSVEFDRRIKAAYSYAKENTNCKIVVTGGQGYDEPLSEGEAARNMLVSLGIDDERILVENKSTSTSENLEFAKVIMEKDGYEESDSVVIVSSAFHLYRAKVLAGKEGFYNVSCLGVVGKPYLLPHYYVREYCAVAFEGLFN